MLLEFASPASLRPSLSTMNAFGLISPSASSFGTIAHSSTRGCVISADSTSNGETHLPLTLNMSSVRPQMR